MDYDGEHDLLWGIAIVVMTVAVTLLTIWLLDG